MLTVLNIIIIVVLLGMAAIWATYGFFSAFLHLVLVIVSGTIAFAVWEPVAFILLGRMPLMAWGVGLLAPFALTLIVLRGVMDKYCKMNLKFPRLADQLGGAACGLASGVLTLGLLLIGIGFLTMKSDMMGYQPYALDRNTTQENADGNLWTVTQVDRWAGSFFSMLSTGAMSPMSGTSLAVYKPDIARRAQVFHLTNDPFQSKVAPPESVQILDAHIIDPDVFLEMVVISCFEQLVTDQIDLGAVETPGDFGEGYAEYIVAEYQRRLDTIGDIPNEERNASNRPSAVFNAEAIDEIAALFAEPGSPAAARRNNTPAGGAPPSPGGGTDRSLSGRVEGAVTPDGPPPAEEGGDAETPEEGESLPPSGYVAMLSDPVAFFDQVIEKQVQPTVLDIQRGLQAAGGDVVIIDTQWANKPVGAYDSDGWLRVALPSIQLTTRSVGGETEYRPLPPIAYSIELNQETGSRLLVDLVGRTSYSADAQINNVKLGWVFALPPGHEPFRFEARQLGFALDDMQAGPFAGESADFWDLVAVVGAIDVPEQVPPPDGIQIGETGAVVELDARLPRSISPNAATGIVSNQEKEPWTAFSGSQANILRGTSGGRRSQMREVYVAGGFQLVRVVVTTPANDKLLGEARQGNMDILVRDSKGAEHAPIGFALMRPDDSMNLSLRDGDYTANRLPRVGTGETLYIYFQVPEGVNVTDFVLGQPDGEKLPFAQPITVE